MQNRSELLLGAEGMARLREMKVVIFGVGGVGSWCAEALLRTGIRHITLVDSDLVCPSNCNRQLMATQRTVGQPKVEALRNRFLDIYPEAQILSLQKRYTEETASDFQLQDYDVIIDAIDSLKDKASLILHATSLTSQHSHMRFFSSMGAALRIDPTQIRVAEFWKVQGDPLARALRGIFRKSKLFPAGKFLCVYSAEPPMQNQGKPEPEADGKVPNGSLCHITGLFGFTLAGLVLKENT